MIKLDVFQLTDRQYRAFDEQYENGLDEDYALFECDLVERYFFTIDNFGEQIDDKTKTRCTSFYSGGMEYITPIAVEDFIKELENYAKSNRQEPKTIRKRERTSKDH